MFENFASNDSRCIFFYFGLERLLGYAIRLYPHLLFLFWRESRRALLFLFL
jgi:hypothetical protein